MADKDRIALLGAPGSPYTRKMLGVLRYRRIAYRFLVRGSPELKGLPTPKVALLPTFIAAASLGDGTLRSLLDDYKAPPLALYALYPPTRQLAVKVRLFIDFLVERIGRVPSWDNKG